MTHNNDDAVLRGGGECGALMRAIDWANNPLGMPVSWAPELRTVVSIALGSQQPMLIVWGPQQITLYNDGYAAMCGARHPAALGGTFHDLWYDIWDTVEPIITDAYSGISTSMDDIEFTMHRNGYAEETHFSFSYTPVRNNAGQVLGMFCACTEISHEVAARRAQLQEHERLLQVMERALGAIAMLSGPDHVFTYVNSDYMQLIGHRDVVGKSVAEGLPEVSSQGFVDLLDNVYRTGTAYEGKGVAIELQRVPGGAPEKRIVDFLYQPTRDSQGRVSGIFVQAIDVTEQVEAERMQTLLNRELGHRMKNQLAMVQAIINQTLRSAPDMQTAGTLLGGRIQVLANAHDILISRDAGQSNVAEIVTRALSLYEDTAQSRFEISGPHILIASRPALSLSLVLHELTTNAAKYGALSVPDGIVNVTWSIERNETGDHFVLSWTERDGPRVEQPTRKGAGSRLIRAGLSGVAEGQVVLDYAPEGLRCRISAELASFRTER